MPAFRECKRYFTTKSRLVKLFLIFFANLALQFLSLTPDERLLRARRAALSIPLIGSAHALITAQPQRLRLHGQIEMIVIPADLHDIPAALRPLEAAAHDLARDIQRVADRLVGHGQAIAVGRTAHERVIGGAHGRYPLLTGTHDDERRLQRRLLLARRERGSERAHAAVELRAAVVDRGLPGAVLQRDAEDLLAAVPAVDRHVDGREIHNELRLIQTRQAHERRNIVRLQRTGADLDGKLRFLPVKRIDHAVEDALLRLGAVDGAHLVLRPVVGDGDVRLTVGDHLLGLIADALDAIRADGGSGAQLLAGGGQVVGNNAVIVAEGQHERALVLRRHGVERAHETRIVADLRRVGVRQKGRRLLIRAHRQIFLVKHGRASAQRHQQCRQQDAGDAAFVHTPLLSIVAVDVSKAAAKDFLGLGHDDKCVLIHRAHDLAQLGDLRPLDHAEDDLHLLAGPRALAAQQRDAAAHRAGDGALDGADVVGDDVAHIRHAGAVEHEVDDLRADEHLDHGVHAAVVLLEQKGKRQYDDDVHAEQQRAEIDVRIAPAQHLGHDVRAAAGRAGGIDQAIARTVEHAAVDRAEHRLVRHDKAGQRERVDEHGDERHDAQRQNEPARAETVPPAEIENGDVNKDRQHADGDAGQQTDDLGDAGHAAGNDAVREREELERRGHERRADDQLHVIKSGKTMQIHISLLRSGSSAPRRGRPRAAARRRPAGSWRGSAHGCG